MAMRARPRVCLVEAEHTQELHGILRGGGCRVAWQVPACRFWGGRAPEQPHLNAACGQRLPGGLVDAPGAQSTGAHAQSGCGWGPSPSRSGIVPP